MKLASRTFFCAIAITALFAGASCSSRVTPDRVTPKKVLRVAEPSALLQALIERNRGINSVQARGELGYRFTYGTKGYRGADVRLAVIKPGKVYARGSASGVGDLFILVSDGRKYWAEVPGDQEVYTGTLDPTRSLEAIRSREEEPELWRTFNPEILSEALLLDDLSIYKHRYFAILPEFYIIALLDDTADGRLVLRRQIWIEREGLTVRRHQVFNPSGELMTEAYLYQYEMVDGVELPRLYRIERYWEELSLNLELAVLTLNPDLDVSLFEYDEIPSGYRLIDIDAKEAK